MNTSGHSSAIRRRRSLNLGFRAFADLLNIWVYRATERRTISELSDLTLRDIGLSRAEVIRESMKPFWRA